MRELSNSSEIQFLVDQFYKKATSNKEIGHFFSTLKLESHLPMICKFWESILLDNPEYKGNPMLKHIELHKKHPLLKKHFNTWLSLWEETVNENFEGEIAKKATSSAKNIANLMQFKIKKNVVLTLDARATYAGGKPFTPIDLAASQANFTEIRKNDEAFSDRYAAYMRFDFKIGIRMNMRNFTHEFMIDIQNITNRENVFIQGYQVSSGQIRTNFQRKLFPAALYRLYF